MSIQDIYVFAFPALVLVSVFVIIFGLAGGARPPIVSASVGIDLPKRFTG